MKNYDISFIGTKNIMAESNPSTAAADAADNPDVPSNKKAFIPLGRMILWLFPLAFHQGTSN